MNGKSASTKDFWGFLGKLAFVFTVLWLFGLLFEFMLLGLLVAGFMLVCFQGYKRFSHRSSKTGFGLPPEFSRLFKEEKGEKLIVEEQSKAEDKNRDVRVFE